MDKINEWMRKAKRKIIDGWMIEWMNEWMNGPKNNE